MVAPPDTAPVLSLRGVKKSYAQGEALQPVLHGVDLEIGRRDFAALIGPSGCGKSTLLNIMGLLDRPSEGTVLFEGRDAAGLSELDRTKLRGRSLGFVFQFHHLLSAFTALENVLMPIRIERRLTEQDQRWGIELLELVGLGPQTGKRANQLSGGQQQRVALARALAMKPALVLADEPTGNLDSEASDAAFALMQRAHREQGCAFLIVTHDPRIAQRCGRIIKMTDGRIVADHPSA